MDSDATRTCFFPWLVPVHHVASLRRPRTSELFIDDIICFSNNSEQHVCDLRRLLERLTKFDPKFAPNKALLGAAETIFLGHENFSEGVGPDPGKVKAMKKIPMSQSVSQLRSLLGALSYYRRQLPKMAARTRPLNSLLRKRVKFEFPPHHERIVREMLDELLVSTFSLSQMSKPLLRDQNNSGSLRTQAQMDSVL